MDWFKCLFCLDQLKDSELVCASSCDHYIHEWCVMAMKEMGDRMCKLCKKNIIVHSVFKEFDLERAVQIQGVPMMIRKLDELISLTKQSEVRSGELQKDFEIISDKLERLSIEHRAIKFERKDSEKRLKVLETEKNQI